MSGRDYSAVREIKARINLAEMARRYMDLRLVSGRWKGLCPFHQEKTPSFTINEQEGFFYCFGCHASGDLIDFYRMINGLEFRDALTMLAEEAGVELTEHKPDPHAAQERDRKRQCLRMYEVASAHFQHMLHGAAGAACRDYIARRHMAPEIVKNFELGWAPDEWQSLADALQAEGFSPEQGAESGLLSRNDRGRTFDRFRARLIFPIKDLSGRVIAFGGRIIEADPEKEQAKYINSSDTPIYRKGEHLYGLFQARRAISAHKRALLTEGYMDVLTLHQFGYDNACGVLGTALTPDQVSRLGGFCSSIDLIFDGDTAGRKAALKSCEMILGRGMQCRVVLMPDGEDVDSLLQGQGTEAFAALLDSAPDGLEYCVDAIAQLAPREILDWVKRFLDSLAQSELRSFYISRLAGGLGLDEAELRGSVVRTDSRRSPRQQQYPGRQSSRQPAVSSGARGQAPSAGGAYGGPHNGQAAPFPQADGGGPFSAKPNSARYGVESGPGWHPDREYGGQSGQGAGGRSRRPWKGRGNLPPSPPPSLAVPLEETVLLFLVRYPHHLPVLEEHGGRELLESPWAERLWEAIVEHGPQDVAMHLTGEEKDFWIRHVVESGVPAEKEQEELADVCAFLEKNRRQQQGQSLIAAMRHMKQGGEQDADMELLRVLNESLGRSNGEY